MKYTRQALNNHPYFSHSIGEKPRNRYDLHFEENELLEDVSAADLNVRFFFTVFEPWDYSFDLEDFLRYQLDNTSYDKKDFINHIRRIIPTLKKTLYEGKNFTDEQRNIETRIYKWLDDERTKLHIVDEVASLPNLSKPQLTLLFRFFFAYFEKEYGVDINKSETARLLHIVTNTDFTKIQNTPFRDLLNKELYDLRQDSETARNLAVVAKELERVGLKNQAQWVRQELDIAINKIKRTNTLRKDGPKNK
jgi:hypothetical protein